VRAAIGPRDTLGALRVLADIARARRRREGVRHHRRRPDPRAAREEEHANDMHDLLVTHERRPTLEK